MRKEDKNTLISNLADTLNAYPHFYVVNIEGLNAEVTTKLRKACYEKEVKLIVVKNTIFKKALEKNGVEHAELDAALKGNTAIMFANTGNLPAKLIKDFPGDGVPALKGAYVEQSFYIGANQLDVLVAIKSKEELVGDIIALLQSPVKNVLSALQGSGNTIHGILETLSNK